VGAQGDPAPHGCLLFLATDLAGQVTGRTLAVDGGMSIAMSVHPPQGRTESASAVKE
jgi:hypothetical protein